MKKLLSLILSALCISFSANANAFAEIALLESGNKVKIKLVDKVTSTINEEGETINFRVAEDITSGDTVLIKEGSRAVGVITELIPKGRLGKEGRVKIEMDYTIAVDGKKIPIYGTIEEYGENKSYESLKSSFFLGGLIANTAFLVTMPVLFFIRGGDASLSPGFQYKARVEKDINVVVEKL